MTPFFQSEKDPATTAKVINSDLEKNSAWATKWKVMLILEKERI